jgi:tetratricopeptide (TPR) repeat protein
LVHSALLILVYSASAQTAVPRSTTPHKSSPRPSTQQPGAPDTLQQHYDAARTYGLTGDQERASAEYKAFLSEALRRTANAHSHKGDFTGASQLFQDALDLAPDDANLHLDYALACLDHGNLPEAKAQGEKAVQLAPNDPHAQFVLGWTLYTAGEYAAAKPHLEAAVVATPTFEVGYNLALTYLKLDDLTHARLLFDEMLVGLGDSASIHIYFGHAYGQTGHTDKAIEEYKRALAKDPKIAQAHYFLGLAYLDRDEDKGWEEDAQEQRAEIQNNPNDFRAHYELGNIALKLRRVDEAEKELKRAAELAPDNPDPLIYLGELYASQNRSQEAEAAMRKAIALTTDVSRGGYQINRAHYVLGRILVQSGQREEGVKELKLSSELREQSHPELQRNGKPQDAPSLTTKENQVHPDPTLENMTPADRQVLESYLDNLKPAIADAYNNLGVAAAGQKNFVEAMHYFHKAAEWNPSLAMVDRNQGMAAFYAGAYPDAIPPLQRQIEQHPDDVRARAALGLSYFSVENYAATVRTLQPLTEEVNSDPGLGLAYAVSLVKTKKYEEGMARLKSLEQANPDSSGVHVAIGEANADQHIHSVAIDEYRKALAIAPKEPRTHFLLGLSLLEQGTLPEAAQEFRTALALDPRDSSTKYHLAYTLIQMQRKEEGQKLLLEVVQQDPKYADAFYQLAKLQLEQGDTKTAISNLEAGAHLTPDSEYIHYQLAMAYRRDSRPQDAEHEMQLYETLKQRRRGDHEGTPSN